MNAKKPKSPGSYEFLLPPERETRPLIDALRKRLGLGMVQEGHRRQAWYDTFDGRLYRHGLLLEFQREGPRHELIREHLEGSASPLRIPCRQPPRRLDDIPAPLWRRQLSPVIGNRALLPLISLRARYTRLVQRDGEGKTRLILEVVDYSLDTARDEGFQRRLRILPVRGYGKSLTAALVQIAGLRLARASRPVACDAMQAGRVDPIAYSSGYRLEVQAGERSDRATGRILAYLADQARRNENGILEDLDNEFLHDFRVALRRGRTLLEHSKGVLPAAPLQAVKRELGWLAERTGPCRDLDVHLEDFQGYRERLPDHLRPGLDPLRGLLEDKRREAHRQLVKTLRSKRYQRLKDQWQALAENARAARSGDRRAVMTVRDHAAERLRKQLRRILRDGRRIGMDSPPQALHDLRKACKKARYLLEFFQGLFPGHGLAELTASLKGLQNVLGRYQDLCVQEHALQDFRHELRERTAAGQDTDQAIAALIARLRHESARARLAFARAFEDFDCPGNVQAVKRLSAKQGKKGK